MPPVSPVSAVTAGVAPVLALFKTLIIVCFIAVAVYAGVVMWLKGRIKNRKRFQLLKNLIGAGIGVDLVILALTGSTKLAIAIGLMMGVALIVYVNRNRETDEPEEPEKPNRFDREPGTGARNGKPEPKNRWKFRDKFELMNQWELALYQRIVEAAPDLYVFSQVSMSQIFHIQTDDWKGRDQLNQVGRKSVDFLICRKSDTSILMAIELNGPSHEREDRQKSDATKRKALEEAGIPLIVYYPDNLPDVATLKKAIALRIVERRWNEEARDERMGRN